MNGEVAIFGGSFNPPHIGHTACLAYALGQYVNHIMVIPAYRHRDKSNLIDFEHRYNMCKLAFGWLPGVYIEQVEKDIKSEGSSLETLKHLQSIHTKLKFRFLIGSDIIDTTSNWHMWEEIVKIAPPLVVDRGLLTPQISSTQLRDNLDDKLVHPKVMDYIKKHNLYKHNELASP